jgi:hypothetical protein
MIAASAKAAILVLQSNKRSYAVQEVRNWHIAAPDVCDGMSTVGEADTVFPRNRYHLFRLREPIHESWMRENCW